MITGLYSEWELTSGTHPAQIWVQWDRVRPPHPTTFSSLAGCPYLQHWYRSFSFLFPVDRRSQVKPVSSPRTAQTPPHRGAESKYGRWAKSGPAVEYLHKDNLCFTLCRQSHSILWKVASSTPAYNLPCQHFSHLTIVGVRDFLFLSA